MKHIHCTWALLLFSTSLVHAEDQTAESVDDLKALQQAAEAIEQADAKVTQAGKMIANRELAREMIRYGRENDNPESIIIGVQILVRNPVTPASKKLTQEQKDAHNAGLEELLDLVGAAVELREDDESLLLLAERVAGELDESKRGLAGGPKSWVIKVDKGKHYQLDPRLVYNAQEAAIITAYAKDPKAMLGGSVRRFDEKKETKRSVGRGKVKVEWNSGNNTTGWDCRIYNLSGPDGLEVTVETN